MVVLYEFDYLFQLFVSQYPCKFQINKTYPCIIFPILIQILALTLPLMLIH